MSSVSSPIQVTNINNKVGTYAISTVGFDIWTTETPVKVTSKTKKNTAKEVVNKIFQECAQCIEDDFWIEKFNNAAANKFPPKFSFHNGILIYRRGAKHSSLEVPNNPYEAAYACMEFFRSNGSIFSALDQQNSLEIQQTRANNTSNLAPITWENSNKKVQECLLSYYVMDMKLLMSLRENEVTQLRQTIWLAISGKYFDKNNIYVLNNRIQSISGLLWDDKNRKFYVDPNIKPNVTRTYNKKCNPKSMGDLQQKDTIPQFGIKWKKYLDSVEKKVILDERRKRRITINYVKSNSSNNDYSILETTTSYTEDYDNITEDGTTTE